MSSTSNNSAPTTTTSMSTSTPPPHPSVPMVPVSAVGAAAVAAGAVHIPISGRWLHIGVTHREPGVSAARWSYQEFNKFCGQAKAWGLSGLHLKVAEGVYLWYTQEEMRMFANIAKQHGLGLVPYGYFYGNTFGMLAKEAQHVAYLGQTFGNIILDLEDQWFGHPDWMSEFGHKIREYGYAGPLIVTTYANSQEKNFPYLQMNEWATAWMPQAYFDVWTSIKYPGQPMGALEASQWLYGQWVALDKACRTLTHKPLVPVLPIISLTNRVPEWLKGQVSDWLHTMQGYGYCGFWYEQVYGPYADTIKAAPMPAVPLPPPPVVVVPSPPAGSIPLGAKVWEGGSVDTRLGGQRWWYEVPGVTKQTAFYLPVGTKVWPGSQGRWWCEAPGSGKQQELTMAAPSPRMAMTTDSQPSLPVIVPFPLASASASDLSKPSLADQPTIHVPAILVPEEDVVPSVTTEEGKSEEAMVAPREGEVEPASPVVLVDSLPLLPLPSPLVVSPPPPVLPGEPIGEPEEKVVPVKREEAAAEAEAKEAEVPAVTGEVFDSPLPAPLPPPSSVVVIGEQQPPPPPPPVVETYTFEMARIVNISWGNGIVELQYRSR